MINSFKLLNKLRVIESKRYEVKEEQLNIMIDPSMILAKRTIKKTIDIINTGNKAKAKLYFPYTLRHVIDKDLSFERSTFMQFFGQNAEYAAHDELLEFLEDTSNKISFYKVPKEYSEKHSEFKNSLYRLFEKKDNESEYLVNALFEEWVFLQEHSYVFSRIKKSFNLFIKAGATSIEVGRKTIDKLVCNKLNIKEDEEIKKLQYLRAFGKWTAVGGTTVWLILEPISGGTASGITNFFLCFDP